MKLSKSSIGFGAYRISSRSEKHRDVFRYALEQGCDLIDTSANYTNGESEKLIGEVLKDFEGPKPYIVTKGGYIQGANIDLLDQLNEKGLAKNDLVEINEELKHSIHPEFLESQIDGSLERLQVESIDCYLLHNPEYYFQQDGSNQEEYYNRIEKAFHYLEEQVQKGRINSYGISSNNFPSPLDDDHVTDLNKVYEIANKLSSDHHFKCIQFPLNLIEIGGMENYDGSGNLIQKAQGFGLTTLINRPLNAFSQNQLLRLADYNNIYPPISLDEATEHFEKCLNLLEEKWKVGDAEEDMKEIPLLKQITEVWATLPSPDAVEQVFFGHYFPFVARVWGNDLTTEESEPFYKLFDIANNLARQQMSIKAQQFRQQAVHLGLLPDEPDTSLAVLAMNFYLGLGIDHVLVGMKEHAYVKELKHFFKD